MLSFTASSVLAATTNYCTSDIHQAVQIVGGFITRAQSNGHSGNGSNGHNGYSSGSWDAQEAATMLAHTARKRWESMSPMIDDITAMVIKLQ
jgi:hypothetical protein